MKKKNVCLIIGSLVGLIYVGMDLMAKKHEEPLEIDSDNMYIKGQESINSSEIIRDVEVGFYEKRVKRFLDKACAFLGMIVLSPLLIGISLAIIIDDPGPVLFKQKRVGKNKRFFNIHKFRTMKTSTPHDVPTHQLEKPEQYITRVGAFLRRTSLDELPQIWDIFRGKMSIIGPRPALWNQADLVAEREKYDANSVQVALSGPAQIYGRDELEIPIKAKLDGEYVRVLRQGGIKAFVFDLWCILVTVMSAIKGDGVVEGGTGEMDKQKKEE